jgi:hypothetical protein
MGDKTRRRRVATRSPDQCNGASREDCTRFMRRFSDIEDLIDCPDLDECSPSPDRLHPGAVETTANLRTLRLPRKSPRCRHRIEEIRMRGKGSRPPLCGPLPPIHRNHLRMRRRTNAITAHLITRMRRRRYCNARAYLTLAALSWLGFLGYVPA